LKRFRKQKLTGGLIEEGTSLDDPAFDEFGDELMNGFDLSVAASHQTPSRSPPHLRNGSHALPVVIIRCSKAAGPGKGANR
jgi:hypothetical protein